MRAALAILPMVLLGCRVLGNSSSGKLPVDAHAKPDARELAEHPCRYGDVPRCVARCESGDPRGCNGAGVLFEFGEQPDPLVASSFYGRACDANYGPGCDNLAWLYLRGRGVPHDPPYAMTLFLAAFDASRLACARGDASGCLLAGEMLRDSQPAALEALAGLREQAGDVRAALTAVEALAEAGSTPEARAEQWMRAARLLEGHGDRDGAIERYKLAVEANPRDGGAAAALREAYGLRGDAASVVTLIQKDKYSPKPVVVTAKVVDAAQSQNGFTVDRQGNVNTLQTLQLGKTTLVFNGAPANGQ